MDWYSSATKKKKKSPKEILLFLFGRNIGSYSRVSSVILAVRVVRFGQINVIMCSVSSGYIVKKVKSKLPGRVKKKRKKTGKLLPCLTIDQEYLTYVACYVKLYLLRYILNIYQIEGATIKMP